MPYKTRPRIIITTLEKHSQCSTHTRLTNWQHASFFSIFIAISIYRVMSVVIPRLYTSQRLRPSRTTMASKSGIAMMYCPSIPPHVRATHTVIIHHPRLGNHSWVSPCPTDLSGTKWTHQFVHIGFGNQLTAVPIATMQQEASETGYIAGRGMETTEAFFTVFLSSNQ